MTHQHVGLFSRLITVGANLFGSSLYAAANFAILVVVGWVSGSDDVARVAYALAIINPVFVLLSFGLRAFVVAGSIDAPFRTYISFRFFTSCLVWCLCIAINFFLGNAVSLELLVALLLLKTFDGFHDLVIGALQAIRHRRGVIISYCIRSVAIALVLACYAMELFALTTMVWSISLTFAVLFIADYFLLNTTIVQIALPNQWVIMGWGTMAAHGLPIGILAFLSSLQTNMPRILIGEYYSLDLLSAYVAMAHVATLLRYVATAIANAFMPDISDALKQNKKKRGLYVMHEALVALVLAGMVLTGVTFFVGEWFLLTVWGEDYLALSDYFPVVIAAAIAFYGINFFFYLFGILKKAYLLLWINLIMLGVTFSFIVINDMSLVSMILGSFVGAVISVFIGYVCSIVLIHKAMNEYA